MGAKLAKITDFFVYLCGKNDVWMTKCIVDCGSTKADWIVADTAGRDVLRFTTPGFNAAHLSEDALGAVTEAKIHDGLAGWHVDEVHFYGAGCIGGEVDARVRRILARLVGCADESVRVASDMIGAARALFGDGSGVACIIGTGSNSCLWIDGVIADNVPALGYILGDEGSGAVIGRRFLGDLYKRLLGRDLIAEFESEYGWSQSDVIRHVYRPGEDDVPPNRFLASFLPFIHRHLSDERVHKLIVDEFKRFVSRNLLQYDMHALPIGFVGSPAYYFSVQLIEALSACGLSAATIMKSPAESLLSYHLNLK